jgi:hypothetical protein
VRGFPVACGWRAVHTAGVCRAGLSELSCRSRSQAVVAFSSNAGADTPKLAVFVSDSAEQTEVQLRSLQLAADTVSTCVKQGDRCTFGTLYIAPGTTDRGYVTAVVALGTKTLEQCAKAPEQRGCIVARRRFTYQAKSTLQVEMQLDLDCQGIACDAFNTCNAGVCTTSELRCTGANCTLAADAGAPIASANDAGLPRDTRGTLPEAGAVGPCPLKQSCRLRGSGDGGGADSFKCFELQQCCLPPPGTSTSPTGRCATSCLVEAYGCCSASVACGAPYECCLRGAESTCVAIGTCDANNLGCTTSAECRKPAPNCTPGAPADAFGYPGSCTP